MKEISLNDEKFFELSIGKRVLKRDVFKSIYSIPLFSSNVQLPFGYVKESNIKDFNHDYLLWGIDGNFEFSIKRKGEKFATTDHCGTIKLLNNNILPEYLLQELLVKKYELGYDRSLRASLANMKEIVVSIPTNLNGQPDLEEQRKLTLKYEELRRRIEPIRKEFDSLKGVLIEFNIPNNSEKVSVTRIFDMARGLSKYTHKYISVHKGLYPVYSSQTEKEGIIGYIDSFDYDKACITWTMDGAEAGSVFLRKQGKFNMTDHCGALFVKEEYKTQIDLRVCFLRVKTKTKKKIYRRRKMQSENECSQGLVNRYSKK